MSFWNSSKFTEASAEAGSRKHVHEALPVSGQCSSPVADSAFVFEYGLHIPLWQGSSPT